MFERFTDRARRVLVLAQEEARLLHHDFIGTEHILLGLIHEGEGLAARALTSLGISLEAVRAKIVETIGPAESAPNPSPPFTPRAKKVLELSLREALQLGHNYIGTEHLLLGLVREGEGIGAQVLQSLGADLPRVQEAVVSLVGGPSESFGPSESSFARGASAAWPEYPTRIVSGPTVGLGADDVEFSVTGVLLYEDAVQVFWRLAGIPKPIADLMNNASAFSLADQRENSAAYVRLSDDLETTYLLDNASVAPRPDDVIVGRSRFTPAPPVTATRLLVIWQGESIAIEL